jgi:hypothetical protein
VNDGKGRFRNACEDDDIQDDLHLHVRRGVVRYEEIGLIVGFCD